MNVAKPFEAVSSGVEADVLVALAGSTMPRSGREVARRAKRSTTGVQHALDRLVEHGLVDRMEAGRTYLYTLNRNHLLAPVVEQMAEARNELIRRLRDEIGAWSLAPVHASLFGSTARKDGDTRSDIDLFLVRPEKVDTDDPIWSDQVERLAGAVRAWTGNHAGVIELSDGELAQLHADPPPVIDELRRDAIDLCGAPTRRLLAGY